MKKKSTSQLRHDVASARKLSVSAFVNLRVLVGLFIALAGAFLALLGLGTFSAVARPAAKPAKAQQKYALGKSVDFQILPPGFDCAQIHQLGIDRQENLHAGLVMLAC